MPAMHPSAIPSDVADRIRQRRGRLHFFEAIDAAKTALVVIDMQHTFVAPGSPSEVPNARAIVPNINRLAHALRARGGAVAWVQATFTRSGTDYWPLFFDHMVTPALARAILEGLVAGAPGHALWPELEVKAGDLRVSKNRYSAFFPGACALPDTLRQRSIDTVLITGTLTNVCCEASARDAMMAGFKTILVADANAARTDAEHQATLVSAIQFFADVYETDALLDLIGR